MNRMAHNGNTPFRVKTPGFTQVLEDHLTPDPLPLQIPDEHIDHGGSNMLSPEFWHDLKE